MSDEKDDISNIRGATELYNGTLEELTVDAVKDPAPLSVIAPPMPYRYIAITKKEGGSIMYLAHGCTIQHAKDQLAKVVKVQAPLVHSWPIKVYSVNSLSEIREGDMRL